MRSIGEELQKKERQLELGMPCNSAIEELSEYSSNLRERYNQLSLDLGK